MTDDWRGLLAETYISLFDEKISAAFNQPDPSNITALIGYSAIREGQLVFGNTAIDALLSDAATFSQVLDNPATGEPAHLKAIAQGVSDLFVTNAVALAINQVAHASHQQARSGIISFDPINSTLDIDLSIQKQDQNGIVTKPSSKPGIPRIIEDATGRPFAEAAEIHDALDILWHANENIVNHVSIITETANSETVLNGHTSSDIVDVNLVILTGGKNIVTGSDNDEIIIGGHDNDVISGGAGKTLIIGGQGDDTIYASNHDGYYIGGNGARPSPGTDASGYDTLSFDRILQDQYALNTFFFTEGGRNRLNGYAVNYGLSPAVSDSGYASQYFDEIDAVIGTKRDDTFIVHDMENVLDNGTQTLAINGNGGSDTFQFGGYLESIAAGGNGDDEIINYAESAVIVGDAGNDTITTVASHSTVFGGSGNDTIVAANGTHTISGGAGDDDITVYDGSGIIAGDDGNDTIHASCGPYQIESGSGDDIIDASRAYASILLGQDGNDTVTGGEGNDFIDGGTGINSLTGGSGADIFLLSTGFSIITDFEFGTDRIKADNPSAVIVSADETVPYSEVLISDGDAQILIGNIFASQLVPIYIDQGLFFA